MSYANVQELEEELRQINAEYDDLDFSTKLKYAHQRLNTVVGRQFIEPKTIEFEEETGVKLDFDSLISFDKVHNVNDNEIVDSSEYSVDNDTATVNFDQSYVDDNFFDGLRLEFYYVPEIFKQLEIWIAMRNILETELIHTSDEVTNTQVDRLNTRVQSVIKNINGRNTSATQFGDNQNIGSQPPRRLSGE